MLDLSILPLYRQGGQEFAEIPGLYAVTPPKRCARGRETDSLILYLEIAGNAPLSVDQYRQLLLRLAQKYYKTPGSVTAALRTLAEALNGYLLNRNLRDTGAGRQGIGLLILAVLRGNMAYLAHCGPVHTFVLTAQGTEHYHDPQTSGRGLGLSRMTPIRFLQVPLRENDYLVLCAQAAPGWTADNLRYPSRQGMEGIRRMLIERAPEELQAALIRVHSGSGQIRLLRRRLPYVDMAHPVQPDGVPAAASKVTDLQGDDAVDQAMVTGKETAVGLKPLTGEFQPFSTPGQAIEPSLARPVEEIPRTDLRSVPSIASSSLENKTSPPTKKLTETRSSRRWTLVPLLLVLKRIAQATVGTLRVLGHRLMGLLRNILPDESVLSVSPAVMIFLAIAIPLTLSVIGAVIFVQRGRSQQALIYYNQAYQAAEYAQTLTEPAEQRAAWQAVLSLLDKAESYAVTQDSKALRAQAQDTLDGLDWVERLDFKQAILGGLGGEIQISRLVATETELYILNAAKGNVLRTLLTGRGYELDPNFRCGPSLGPTIVGPLIDIVALPPGAVENAVILGMDASGALLYCIPGKQPLTAVLTPPSMNFGEPKGFVLDRGDLYVLDPDANAVWIYRNMDFAQQPRFFFGDEVPPMQDVVDLAVNGDDLFLLHADGHITKCVYSSLTGAPTRCEDPYPFTDLRPGRQGGNVIPDALFNQIYFSPPPEPSLYLLDPSNQAIYYLSMRLNLQRQYRPLVQLAGGQATAFAVSPTRLIFIATGNQVYYAALP